MRRSVVWRSDRMEDAAFQFRVDLEVENKVIVEIKPVAAIACGTRRTSLSL